MTIIIVPPVSNMLQKWGVDWLLWMRNNNVQITVIAIASLDALLPLQFKCTKCDNSSDICD